MTQFVETVFDELFESMNATYFANIFKFRINHVTTLRSGGQNVSHQDVVRPKEAHVLVQDVCRCRLPDTTLRFASSLVAIAQAERVQAAHWTNSE